MNVSELRIGDKRKIAKVGGVGVVRHRLLEMGIIPGTQVSVTKKAPLGDPIQIHIRGYELSIRKEDALLIELSEEEEKR